MNNLPKVSTKLLNLMKLCLPAVPFFWDKAAVFPTLTEENYSVGLQSRIVWPT